MIFARAAAQVLVELGMDVVEFERRPTDTEYRQRLHTAFFGGIDDNPPDERVVVDVLDRERKSGFHPIDMTPMGPSFAQGDVAATLVLTRQTKSALLMFRNLFLGHVDFARYVERFLIVIPSTRQDAYVHRFRGERYIVLSYGLVQALEFGSEQFLIDSLLDSDDVGYGIVRPAADRINILRHGVLVHAEQEPILLPSLAVVLSNLELLDCLCGRTFAMLFVVAHEAVHADEQHDTLFDLLSETYPGAHSIRGLVESWSVSPSTALELHTDERAYYMFDSVGAWPNMSAAIATYFLTIGMSRYHDTARLEVVSARVRNLAHHHLGAGNAATFGRGGGMIAQLDEALKGWLEEERPSSPDQNYSAWWDEYQYMAPKVQRYLMLQLATALWDENTVRTPMSDALAQDAPTHDPFGLHPPVSSQNEANDAIAAVSEELERLRRSMGPSTQEKVALAGGLEAAAQMAAQLGRWDAATTWSAEVVELCRALADEDWSQHAETLALTLVNYSAMLGLSVHDPKAAQRRRTEITRTTIDELRRSDPATGMRLLAERHRAGLRIDERLTACAEAIQIFRRRHAEAGSTDVLRHLIGALGNQAGVLLDDFRHDEAETAAWEAVELCRAASSDVSFLPDLARTLYNAGLTIMKRKSESCSVDALPAVREAGVLYVRLMLAGQGTYLSELTEVTRCLGELGEHRMAEELIAAVRVVISRSVSP